MKLIKVKTISSKGSENIQFIDAKQIMSMYPKYKECSNEEYFGIEFYQAAYVHAFARLDLKFEDEKLLTKLIEKLVDKLKKEDVVDFNKLANEL